MKLSSCILALLLLTSCWPTSVSFKDTGSMPVEWKMFHIQTLMINAANSPLFYGAQLTEKLKDGVQNNTRLSLATKLTDAEVQIEGQIIAYQVSPIAIQKSEICLCLSSRFILLRPHFFTLNFPPANALAKRSSLR